MKLRKQTLRIIIALLVISLGGLVALQYVLLTDAINQKEQTFRRNVHAAMNAVAERLETGEAAGQFFKMIVRTHGNESGRSIHVNVDTMIERSAVNDSIILFAGINLEKPPIWFEQDTIRYVLDKPQRVVLSVFNAVGNQDTVLFDTIKSAGMYTMAINEPKYARGEYFFKLFLDSAAYTMRVSNGDIEGVLPRSPMVEQRKKLVGRVMENLSAVEREPIERRIKAETLDSLLRLTLTGAGIELPYAFGVLEERNDSLKIIQPSTYTNELRATEFKSKLFPGDFLFSGNQLLLYFPGQEMYLLKQLGPQLGLTVLFTSILLFCFAYAVRTIIKQKEFALRLVEFINNMTHEFKTPISTISVAAETIMRQDVIEQREKVLRYGAVIRDENLRMKSQVDKILQMAVLEEGDFELKLSAINIHEIVAKAVENIALHVEANQGKVRCKLEAERAIINADPVHVTNIIHNVLDNANKYSPLSPDIVVSTTNENNKLIVRVEDHGIGITKEDIKRVFDKYYRVPTGNRHDVKGFGLGLSYVALMMNAHGGSVSLESENNKGTIVTLTFPLPNDSQE